MLGRLPDGSREVLTVVNHPTEGAIAWEMELQALKERGVKQIDLIVSDALSGIENAVCSAFPTALHQLCVVHFKRKVLNTFLKRQSRARRGTQRTLSYRAYRHDASCGL